MRRSGCGFVESRFVRHRPEGLQAHLLVKERLPYLAVLLSLDHEPARIAMRCGRPQRRHEVDAALWVARHGEYALADALQKRQVVGANTLHDFGPDVLAVNVGDAIHVFPRHLGRVRAAKRAMAGVEQKPRMGPAIAMNLSMSSALSTIVPM